MRLSRGRPAPHTVASRCGYPDRLAGTEIPLGARIIASCDAFEAMISDRPCSAVTPTRTFDTRNRGFVDKHHFVADDANARALRRCRGSSNAIASTEARRLSRPEPVEPGIGSLHAGGAFGERGREGDQRASEARRPARAAQPAHLHHRGDAERERERERVAHDGAYFARDPRVAPVRDTTEDERCRGLRCREDPGRF